LIIAAISESQRFSLRSGQRWSRILSSALAAAIVTISI